MKKYLLSLVTIFLVGCGTSNYISIQDNNLGEILINDLVKHMNNYYPPAHTTINIHSTATRFEMVLDKKLRQQGYAVSSNEGKKIIYMIDDLNNNLFRATYKIDVCTFSKVYYLENKDLKSFSSWTSTNCTLPVFNNNEDQEISFGFYKAPIKDVKKVIKKTKKATQKTNPDIKKKKIIKKSLLAKENNNNFIIIYERDEEPRNGDVNEKQR